ncbi:MAG: hypothetical protein KJN76_14065 [Eudoraea sp.]|nr:hypothetical protein [Eudoraea sp.]
MGRTSKRRAGDSREGLPNMGSWTSIVGNNYKIFNARESEDGAKVFL